FVGQVGSDMIDREAFQEIDYRRMFGQMTKWVAQIDRADRIPEYISRAFQTATSGRPGPVVLALPEDMLVQQVDVQDVSQVSPIRFSPTQLQCDSVRALLDASSKPLVILGGGGWSDGAYQDIQ
ncbi:MAG: thiamine pyrophosphate-binding protein, partial [Betaproteobacteria bacterium]